MRLQFRHPNANFLDLEVLRFEQVADGLRQFSRQCSPISLKGDLLDPGALMQDRIVPACHGSLQFSPSPLVNTVRLCLPTHLAKQRFELQGKLRPLFRILSENLTKVRVRCCRCGPDKALLALTTHLKNMV